MRSKLWIKSHVYRIGYEDGKRDAIEERAPFVIRIITEDGKLLITDDVMTALATAGLTLVSLEQRK